MEVFAQLLNNINDVQNRLPVIFIDTANKYSDELIDLNVEQLSEGRNNEGQLISPGYRSDEYANLKKALGSKAPKGTPDLILEGDFTGAFYTEKRGDALLIDSRDDKTSHLDEKYSGIFGLNKKSQKEFNEILLPETFKIIANGITKGM